MQKGYDRKAILLEAKRKVDRNEMSKHEYRSLNTILSQYRLHDNMVGTIVKRFGINV